MKDSDIEWIMAYADGQLPRDQVDRVEALLRADGQARDLLAHFRQTGALLEPLTRDLLHEPVPSRLIDTVRDHARTDAPPGASATITDGPLVKPLPVAPRTVEPAGPPANDSRFWPQAALAAGLALVIGAVVGHWWAGRSTDTASTLASVLQSVPSGSSAPLADGKVLPLASFRRSDGTLCREFEQSLGGRLSHGFACRADGVWITQMIIDGGAEQGRDGQPPAFVPATGQADALAAMAEALGLGQALDPGEEEALIGRGWTEQP